MRTDQEEAIDAVLEASLFVQSLEHRIFELERQLRRIEEKEASE